MFRRSAMLAATLSLLVLSARPAAALEVTPFAGAMMPVKTLFMDSGGSSVFRMGNHSVYGLSLGTTVSDRLGVELALGAGSGKIELIGGGELFELESTMLFADLRGRVGLAGGEDASLGLVLGGGYTNYKIGIFDLAEENDQGKFLGRLTGVAGLDVRAGLSDRVKLTVSALDRIHVSGIALDTAEGSEKTQHDLMFTAGLRFPLD
ncbi:MAG: outer membrane beta-barrel protein [Candidatus Eisenbacteria bacterium]